MKKYLPIIIIVLSAVAVVFFAFSSRGLLFISGASKNATAVLAGLFQAESDVYQSDAAVPSEPLASPDVESAVASDIPDQSPLAPPPANMRGIYLTGWTVHSDKKVDDIIAFIKKSDLNTVVIDIKDYSGYVTYKVSEPTVEAIGANGNIKISQPNALIKKMHDEGIYVIGRVTVFEDPVFASAHPAWAIKNRTTGHLWLDPKGLAWMDPAATSTWQYTVTIAKDALRRGFDEINFDYIRFPYENQKILAYPVWDYKKTSKQTVLGDFFRYVRGELPQARLSADLFGLATIEKSDMGIGQVIEDASRYFDYISPMVYPSHFGAGFLGYKNPAEHPYEVIKVSMDRAVERLKKIGQDPQKLRPWIQDFDLGANYGIHEIQAEKKAIYDAGLHSWMSWDPSNQYTRAAYQK
jgi:hypothetical protein